MTVRWRVQGEGFSAKAVAAFPADAGDVLETLKVVAGARGFEGWVRQPEQMTREILAEAGVDPDRIATWKVEGDSPVAYAQAVLHRIAIIRDAIARGDADAAARYAAELGFLVREADLKFEFEAAAVRGAKVRRGADKGGAAKRGGYVERDRAMAQEFEERRGASGMSESALKAAIGKSHGLGRSTAIKAIDRVRKEIVSDRGK